MSGKKPCELLREYRERAGVSKVDAAKACGFKGDNPTVAYDLYENPKKRGDKLIPNGKIIQPLLRLLVGKGHPTVTVEDMLSISDAKNLPQMLESVARQNEIARAQTNGDDGADESAPMRVPNVGATARHVPIRFRIETGVYMSQDVIARRRYGWSPFVYAIDFPDDRQFAVAVVDDDVDERYPAGLILHCIEATEYSPDALAGRDVIVRKRLSPDSDIVSMCVGQRGTGDRKEELYDMRGKPIAGEVYGVIYAKYLKM